MNALRLPSLRASCGVLIALLITQMMSPAHSAAPPRAGPAGDRGKIDVERPAKPGEYQMKVFSLSDYRIEPDEGLESMLRLLFPSARAGKFMLDRRRKVIVVFADQTSLQRVEHLLNAVRILREGKKEPASADVQVRLFWLVDGPSRRVSELPENLKEVAAELRRLGMERPRLATQVTISTELGGRFETAASVMLAAFHELTISGTTIDRNDKVGLSLTVGVNQSSPRRASRRISSLRTQVSIPFDRPMVLGVTPSEVLTSAFVVEVVRKMTARAGLSGFEFQNAPWSKVFAWLADQTGKTVLAPYKPAGTFSFRGPLKKIYTIGEVIDILNEELMASRTQPYCIVQRERTFVLVPADERMDPGRVPRVTPDELDGHGRTELVCLVLKPKTLVAKDFGPEVKKMLGPFGEVVVLTKCNQLLIQDTVGNLRRIVQVLKDIENQKK